MRRWGLVVGVVGASCTSAWAGEIKVGPIEVGKTGCQEAYAAAVVDEAFGEKYQNAMTRGIGVEMGENAFGLSFVRQLSFVCDPANETVHSVQVLIAKGDAARIADALGAKYVEEERRLPALGDGIAAYVSDTGWTKAIITYEHASFTADLNVATTAWDDAVKAAVAERDALRDEDLLEAF